MNRGDFAVFVTVEADAFHKVCTLESYLVAGEKPEILFNRLSHKVLALNKKLSSEKNFSCAHFGGIRVNLNFYFFGLTLGIIVYNYLERVENSHCSRSVFVKLVTYAGFEKIHTYYRISL